MRHIIGNMPLSTDGYNHPDDTGSRYCVPGDSTHHGYIFPVNVTVVGRVVNTQFLLAPGFLTNSPGFVLFHVALFLCLLGVHAVYFLCRYVIRPLVKS